jgi:hypothetical protein
MAKFVLLVPVVAALLAAARAPAARDSGSIQNTFAYRVSDQNFSWDVHQGTELTVVRSTGSPDDGGGEIMMVSGPGVGGPAARLRSLPVLARALGGPETVGPGHVSRSGYGGTAVLDSMRYTLRPGGQTLTIGGRTTTHRVLTVETWWIDRGEDGGRTAVRVVGRSDLWFAGDLPFSLVPITMPPPPGSAGAALPLSFHHPEVSAHVLAKVRSELEPLGLLLRAQVVDSVVPSADQKAEVTKVGVTLERSIEVDSIRDVAEEPSAPEWTSLPVLSAPQGMALQIALVAVGQSCREERTAGTFEFTTTGPVSFMGSGTGAALRDGDETDSPEVVLRGGGQDVVECTLIMLSDSVRTPGRYQVVAPSLTSFAGPGPEAVVVHILTEPAAQILNRFVVLERGEVRLERAEAATVKGTVQGTGWVVELDPRRRTRVVDDLKFDAAFVAEPDTARSGN